jgi:membrane dipeptidase
MIFLRGKYKNHIYDNEFQYKFENGGLPQHVDIPRLEQGMQGGAFWSAFWPCPPGNATDFSDERYSDSKQRSRADIPVHHANHRSCERHSWPA